MKKWPSRILILLIIFSQLGLIGIQAYWLQQNYQDKKQFFEAQISKVAYSLYQMIDPGDPLHNTFLKWKNDESLPNKKSDPQIEELLDKLNNELLRHDLDTSYSFQLLKGDLPSFLNQRELTTAYLSPKELSQYQLLYTSSAESSSADIWIKGVCYSCQALIGLDFKKIRPSFFLWQISKWIIVSLFLTLIHSGIFIYILWNISRQQQLAALKDAFINHMTHELNTPIFSISLALKHLKTIDLAVQTKEARKYLQIISDEQSRLKNNVQRALDITRLESETFILKKEIIDISQLIEQIKDLFLLSMPGKKLEFFFSPPSQRCNISGDRHLLFNVLYNLIDNAIKYTSQQPVKIYIKTLIKGDQLLISIQDNGPGISIPDQQRIFDKFYRIKSHQHTVKGTGLGLNYAQLVVKAHGGNIELESTQGKGSNFTIYLPFFNE